MIGSGWIALTLVALLILTLRYRDQIVASWRGRPFQGGSVEGYKWTGHERVKEAYRQLTQEKEWADGKQVTFMEPDTPASPVVKVDSKPVVSSITALYDSMTPRDQSRFKAGLPPYLLKQLRDYERTRDYGF